MKVLTLAAAAVLSLAGVAAHATVTNWGVLDAQEGYHAFTAPGSFDDFYTFSVSPGSVDASAVASMLNTKKGLTGDVKLYQGTYGDSQADAWLGSFSFDSAGHAYSFNNLTGGNYYFEVAGKVTGTKGGSYTLDASPAAVPEPESLALMLAGCGALGMVARRRRTK